MILKALLKRLLIFILIGASVIGSLGNGYTKKEIVVPTLTLKQKETDIKYFAKLVRDEYPFAEINVKIKKLHDIGSLERIYLKKAIATKSNEEFYEAFKEYLTQIQSPLGYTVSEQETKGLDNWAARNFFGISRKAIIRANYWSAIDTKLFDTWYAYSHLNTIYGKGKNYLLSAYIPQNSNEKYLPAGTVIEKINGVSTDDYAKVQSNKVRLHFDPIYQKVFMNEPLTINPGSNPGWQVEFRLPDGTKCQMNVPKRSPHNPVYPYPNTFCVELTENVGYIRIFGFEDGEFTDKDHQTIQEFIKKAKGKYRKLIIDIRENVGGNPKHWMDSIIAPFIKKPIVYQENFAIRRKIPGFGFKFFLYKLLGSNVPVNLTSSAYYCMKVEELPSWPGFDQKKWRFFRFTREIKPQNPLLFNGQIFLFTSVNCYSASEIFVSTVKKTGFAKILGTRTGGGAAVLSTPPYFVLPESSIIFRFDVDYVFNPDGKPNETNFTEPDIYLSPEFPPQSDQKEVLIKDPWIEKVLAY